MIAAAGAVAPAGASAAGITLRLAGAERHFNPDEIDAAVDRPAGSYLLRAPGTSAERVALPPALSLRRLVGLAGASPDAVSFVTVERPNGTLALLRRGDLADPPPFLDGPPIVWIDAGGTRYLRPLRSRSDVNATDNIGVTEGDLEVRVHHGRLLGVRARADRRELPAGEPVSLTAEVTGASPGRTLSFDWTFGDGTEGAGRAVRHRFRTPGVYAAVVSVAGADDSGGSSAPLRIVVGDPAKDGGDTGGGTGDRRRSPAQGPVRSDGTGGDAGDQSSTPAASSSSSSRPTSKRSEERNTTPLQSRQPPPTRAVDAPMISGTLVAARDGTPLAADSAPSRGGAQAAARQGTDPRRAPFAWLAGILAAATLVWLGGRRERRQLRARAEPAR